MPQSESARVGDVTETDLIAAFAPYLPRGERTLLGPGDDAAVVALDGELVVSTDVLVAGHHFRTDWSAPEQVGARAAAQNLADIAAMGAESVALVVALVLPAETPVVWVEGLARGLAYGCAPHGVGVVGGDLSAGELLTVAVTAMGRLIGDPVTRSGARPGDVVALAGAIGRSAAGLAVLQAAPERPAGSDAVVGAFLVPTPPLAAGPEAARHGASAMLDVSDGLLRDAGRIAASSGVVLDLSTDALAGQVEAVREVADTLGADPLTWVLTGGEDHALLATFPAHTGPSPSFAAIGKVRAPRPGERPGVLVDGEEWAGVPGWDHFAQD